MRASGYVPPSSEFSNAIIYIPPMTGKPVWIPMADAPVEASAMLTAWESEFFTPANQQAGLTVADYLKLPRQSSLPSSGSIRSGSVRSCESMTR
jgi:hypothetical protein